MADAKPRRKITIRTLQKRMRDGEAITQLAAYDYRTAVVADRLGIDILCVSDTGGMILFGFLVQWPTILTLAMFPILTFMYWRLALVEEREAERAFGDEYRRYASRTPRFLPRLSRQAPTPAE